MNNPIEMRAPAPLLELRDIRRSFLQGTVKLDVLNNASLLVRAGEMKALVGPSGSGKSTLLNIAGLLEYPDAGEVLIDGVDAGKLGQACQHRHHQSKPHQHRDIPKDQQYSAALIFPSLTDQQALSFRQHEPTGWHYSAHPA